MSQVTVRTLGRMEWSLVSRRRFCGCVQDAAAVSRRIAQILEQVGELRHSLVAGQAGNVFHQDCPGFELRDEPAVLADEVVSGLGGGLTAVEGAQAREALTRWTAGKQVELTRTEADAGEDLLPRRTPSWLSA